MQVGNKFLLVLSISRLTVKSPVHKLMRSSLSLRAGAGFEDSRGKPPPWASNMQEFLPDLLIKKVPTPANGSVESALVCPSDLGRLKKEGSQFLLFRLRPKRGRG